MTNPFNLKICFRFQQTVTRHFAVVAHLTKTAISLWVLAFVVMSTLNGAPTGVTTHPKYLVPINPNNREYERAIEKLLNGRQGRGTMIYTESPYAEGDFVISAWGKDRSDVDPDHPAHNFLTLIKVSPGNPGEATLKDEIEIPIDSQFAASIEKAWKAVLLKTRYPEDTYLGLDGSQTEFSVFVRGLGTLYGQLWSPSKGLPKELMDAGFSLAKYVEASTEERISMRDKLIRRLGDLSTKSR
jgi:hypothetical protein